MSVSVSPSTTTYAIVALVAYLVYVRTTRFSRIKAIHEAYAKRHGLARPPPLQRVDKNRAPSRKDYPMTPAEAQKILTPGAELEFPFTLTKALEFALFLTYGIETISDVLLSSREFTDDDKAGRRYVDTSVLIGSFIRYPIVGPGSGVEASSDEPQDPRGAIALARINLQHSHYKKITNNDMLYTLSTFIREPYAWTNRFEWRALSPLEEIAWYVFFAEVGRRMGIEDIPTDLQEMLDWTGAYEAEAMYPNELSRKVADATTALLLFGVPDFLKPAGVLVVSTLMSDRLRAAVKAPEPPRWLTPVVHSGLHLRAFLIRHFGLARPQSLAVSLIPSPEKYPAFPRGYKRDLSTTESKADEKTTSDMYAPMSHPNFYHNEPWYISETSTLSKWIQKSLVAVGAMHPRAVPGKAFKPEGYRLENMGPAKMEGKQMEEVRQRAEKIHGGKLEGPYAVGGTERIRCPFAA